MAGLDPLDDRLALDRAAARLRAAGTTRLRVVLPAPGDLLGLPGPGPFATEINTPLLNDPEKHAAMVSRVPMGRWGDPLELGPAAIFLASEASSFMTGVIRRAPASRAPRKIPGKASTLLIWFGKSDRPVATTVAYFAATSGMISGSGLARANTIASAASSVRYSSGTVPPDTPTNTSAPSRASLGPPISPRGLVRPA